MKQHLSNDQQQELTDYFSGFYEANMCPSLRCPLGQLQNINCPSKDSSQAYYRPSLDKMMRIVREERAIRQALSKMPRDEQNILACYYTPLPQDRLDDRHIRAFGSLARLIYRLNQSANTLSKLSQIMHQALNGKRNTQATISAIAKVKRMKSDALALIRKAQSSYSLARTEKEKKEANA